MLGDEGEVLSFTASGRSSAFGGVEEARGTPDKARLTIFRRVQGSGFELVSNFIEEITKRLMEQPCGVGEDQVILDLALQPRLHLLRPPLERPSATSRP